MRRQINHSNKSLILRIFCLGVIALSALLLSRQLMFGASAVYRLTEVWKNLTQAISTLRRDMGLSVSAQAVNLCFIKKRARLIGKPPIWKKLFRQTRFLV